jgi:hypothetical protein
MMAAASIAGYAVTARYMTTRSVAQEFKAVQSNANGQAEFRIWTATLSAVVGLAGGLFIFFLLELQQLLSKRPSRHNVISVVAAFFVVAGAYAAIGLVLHSVGKGANATDTALTNMTRPLTYTVAALLLPGLMVMFVIGSLAAEDGGQLVVAARLRVLRELRSRLRRNLGALGVFLTLLVIATGLRRQALLALQPTADAPVEGALLYGLVFAVVLGAFFLLANVALDGRAGLIVDQFAPTPDPADAKIVEQVQRRKALTELAGIQSGWKTFQDSVIIAGPLLAGLITGVTGK